MCIKTARSIRHQEEDVRYKTVCRGVVQLTEGALWIHRLIGDWFRGRSRCNTTNAKIARWVQRAVILRYTETKSRAAGSSYLGRIDTAL